MVYDREEAALRAEASHTNVPNTCQLWTREMFGTASVGDFDGDGAADAEDGWKSEPAKYKHPGDRNPPRGVPVSYVGGSHDNGHRAISLGNGQIRSTDAGGSGVIATVSLDWPERVWGLKYVGWSETCDGVLIETPPPPPPPGPKTRGGRVDEALHDLRKAAHDSKDGTKRDNLLKRAIRAVRRVPTWRKKR